MFIKTLSKSDVAEINCYDVQLSDVVFFSKRFKFTYIMKVPKNVSI